MKAAVVGGAVPWSGWLKLRAEQRAGKHGAQSPSRPHTLPIAAGPSLSAAEAESPERPSPPAQTGRAQAG